MMDRLKFFKKEQGESQLNLVIDGEQVEVELQQELPQESFKVFDIEEPTVEFDYMSYEFNTTASKPVKSIATTGAEEEVDFDDIKFPTQRLYRLNFRTDNTMLQLNHTFINGQYQAYNGGPYTNSGLGVNTKIGDSRLDGRP